jgi:hypothetical protein
VQLPVSLSIKINEELHYCKIASELSSDKMALDESFPARLSVLLDDESDVSQMYGNTYLLQYGGKVLGEAVVEKLA